jgi:SAM-dependent methyltransferase
VALCKRKLEPLGICVKQVFKNDQLPFEDNSFDIVINRHETYVVKEVKRILKVSGLFISQQVGGKNNNNLSERIIRNFKPLDINFDLSHELIFFNKEGFEVIYTNEYFPYLRFYDIGAIVYWARIIKWEFPNFSVENCFEQLYNLEIEKNKNGYIESKQHRFIMVLKNNK